MIDFLIIGGGIAGVSAAARLARLGRVVVLERETALATHASGRSAALWEENYGAPSVNALNRASHAYLTAQNVLSPRGLMLVGTADSRAAFDADVAALKLTPMAVDDAQAVMPLLDPAVVTSAAMSHGAQDIDTDRLVQGFARDARAHGAVIETQAEVIAINRQKTCWQIHTAHAVYDAKAVVNAAGAWADVLAKMAGIIPVGLGAYRRSMARIALPQGYTPHLWPILFGPGESWYAKPDAGAMIVSPADETLVVPHDAYAEDLTLAEGLDRYERHVTAPVTRLLSSWAGLRTFAPDRQLVIGPSAQDATFIWCAGQGGYGMQTSPAASQLLADLIAGTPPEIDAAALTGTQAARFGP